MIPLKTAAILLGSAVLIASCEAPPTYDVIIRGGTVYDGRGGQPVAADIAIQGDSVVEVAQFIEGRARTTIDAHGLAVAPGFINMLSWATESLIEDGRGESDIRQGVTLEVFGEGWSMGPLTDSMKADMVAEQGDIKFDIPWTTLGEYLDHLVARGVSPNVASFVGATTVRIHEIGYEDRAPTADELDRMRGLVAAAMEEGAIGVGSSLIYAPAFYASTAELTALAEVAGGYGGMYISHLRSEGDGLLPALDEFLAIAKTAGVRAEVYHLKAAGQRNWRRLDTAIARIERARADGLEITADIYTYTAGATGLDAAMPPWVQEGGLLAWIDRLGDPAVRERMRREMRAPSTRWENLYAAAGGADQVLLVGFKQDSLKYLTGKTLAEVAAMRGASPEDVAMDLVMQDGSRVGTVYFLMSEDNVRKKVGVPWVHFGSDAGALAPAGVFLRSNPHPRAYGNFARLLGRYVREERVISLEEAIHRLTGASAETLRLERRGVLAPGFHADLAIFDPRTIIDNATYDRPHQFATGMVHVLVNGVPVLLDGEHTGAMPGRVVRGPGWKGR
ncbi:MAG: D-aminoacylase [Gemmatimonadales bacterium]|nr:MAG: D-aminoacylase [Gemmatimonadales bacterium]